MTYMQSFVRKNTLLAVVVGLALLVSAFFATMAYAESPANCSSDESSVNISADKIVAEIGETITFTVTAENEGLNGCDIENRTITLTLPDDSVTVFGPFNYPFPSVSAAVGSVPYIADGDDLTGGVWTAEITWDGILKSVSDQDSTGAKSISVNEVVDLEVTKTAVPAAEETYGWTIDKSVSPATWDLFNGDSGTSEYTIGLTKTLVGTVYSVSGTITITNPNDVENATVESVSDVISGYGNADTVTCDETLPFVLGPGESLDCSYSSSLPDDLARTNTATVTTSGLVDGGEGEAEIDFSEVVPSTLNNEVHVDDTFDAGDAGPFSTNTSYSYTRQFVCGGENDFSGTGNDVNNTATIVETQDSDDASVTINCYDLSVEKTAETTFDREWDWTIEKSADNQTDLNLANGEAPVDVNYTVSVDAVSTDLNHAVSGTITITNNHPSLNAELTDVADTLSIDGVANVDCGGVSVVPANSFIECSYSASNLTDDQTNTATATQQNYDYDEEGVPTVAGTTDYSGNVAVTLGQVLGNETDECVDVSDDNVGPLGQVCAGDEDKTFNYSLGFGTTELADVQLEECSEGSHPNVADFITNDTLAVGEDTWTVNWTINCEVGCTLTQGYWKTHNDKFWGGAPADLGWSNIGDWDNDDSEELELEDLTPDGDTWFNVFWTPTKGNYWYQLAHQWMAAYLNSFFASTDAIGGDETLQDAYEWLVQHADNGKIKKKDAEEAKEWASLFASFNEGEIGPGHCDEPPQEI